MKLAVWLLGAGLVAWGLAWLQRAVTQQQEPQNARRHVERTLYGKELAARESKPVVKRKARWPPLRRRA